MASIVRLAVSLTANTRGLNRGLKRGRKQVNRFADAVKRIGPALGLAAIGEGFRRILRSTEEFNQAMRSSLAIMGNVTEQLSQQMERAAFKIAATTKFAAKEAAEAYFFLASAGLSAKQSLAALPTVAKFAQAGMFDLALATDLLTDAQSALGLSVDDTSQNLLNMTRVADVLVKANTLANATVQQFSEALTTKAGAALRIVGKEIEEGAAVLAVFADQGIKAAQAGTALQIVMRDLQTKALQNTAMFRAMNISVFDAAGDMRNIADIIEDLERRMDGMSDAGKKTTLMMLGFTDKSIAFIQALIGMSAQIREMEAALKSAGGTMAEVAEKQMGDLEKGWKRVIGGLAKTKPIWDKTLDFIAFGLNDISDAAALVEKSWARIQGFAALGRKSELTGLLRRGAGVEERVRVPAGITRAEADRIQASFGPSAIRAARLQQRATEEASAAATAAAASAPQFVNAQNLINSAREMAIRIEDRLTAARERALQVGQRILRAIQMEQRRIASLSLERQRLEELAQPPAERLRRRLAEIQELKRLGLSDRAAEQAADRALERSQEQAKLLSRQRLGEPQPQTVGGLAQVNLARQAVFGIQQARNKPQAVKDPQLVKTNLLLGGILDRFKVPSLGPALTAP